MTTTLHAEASPTHRLIACGTDAAVLPVQAKHAGLPALMARALPATALVVGGVLFFVLREQMGTTTAAAIAVAVAVADVALTGVVVRMQRGRQPIVARVSAVQPRGDGLLGVTTVPHPSAPSARQLPSGAVVVVDMWEGRLRFDPAVGDTVLVMARPGNPLASS